jgi:hypothetical protein
MDVDLFLQSLIHVNDKLSQSIPTHGNNDDLNIFEDLLRKHPILSSLIEYYSKEKDNVDQTGMLFLTAFIDNLTQNLSRPKSSYRYNEHVQKFSVVFFHSCWS